MDAGITRPNPVDIANPASVYCSNIGGKIEIHKDTHDNETDYCRLPYGKLCEEWTLFREQKCMIPKN